MATNLVTAPAGFLSPDRFHDGQWRVVQSITRITAVPSGQGGGKTSIGYWRLYGIMKAYPGESHLIGFPDYPLLTRVVLNQPDPDRCTLVDFLRYLDEDPHLHIMEKWIGCKSGKIFFASAGDLIGWEGAHVKSAWLDEFDECPLAAFDRAMERTRMRMGYVTITGTPRNVAWIKQKIDPDAPDVTYINFKSTDNPTYPQEAMDEAKAKLPKWEYERIYLGLLSGMKGGNLFHREWWQIYDSSWDMPTEFLEVIQVWDTANKAKTRNDYSVCATWGRTETGLYLLDIYRKRLEYPELLQAATDLYRDWDPGRILIEDKASGTQLIQDLKRGDPKKDREPLPVIACPADIDKYRRASAVTGLVHAGLCYLPMNAKWKNEFIEEHAAFPDTDYDDQVDTTSNALAYFKGRINSTNTQRGIQGEHSQNELIAATTNQVSRSSRSHSKWMDR